MKFYKYLLLIVMCQFTLSLYAQQENADMMKKELERNLARFSKMNRVDVPSLPFLQLNEDEIASARKRVLNDSLAGGLKASYIAIADEWRKRDYNFVKHIIPEWGSLYVYGLGLNFDPIEKERMQWCGWSNPRHVRASDGSIYPNDTYPDDGSGWTDVKTGEKYYFTAFANGMTIKQLERVDLPALVNAFVLTGDEEYATRALWIMDGIATIYPRAYEGPIDYPGATPGRRDGGRLDRPQYQASRAMMNYAFFYEALSLSKNRHKPSPSNPTLSMFRNIEINLLMDGAEYCFRMTHKDNGSNRELHNGNIDYNRSPLLVGALLGIPEWVEWALNGPLGFRYIATNTIDINGRYYESSPLYAHHTIDLVMSDAQVLARMRLPAYPQGYNAFNDERLGQFALNFYTGIAVSGHMPLFGDSGPDFSLLDNDTKYDSLTLLNAKRFYYYADDPSVKKNALEIIAQMSPNRPVEQIYTKWELYKDPNLNHGHVDAETSNNENQRSTLLFDNGTLVLKSRQGDRERGALLRFGPTLNHGQADEVGLTFYAKGREFSADPGYFNTHFRYGFTTTTVAHNVLVVNERSQLRVPSSGGELISWNDGDVLRSAEVNDPKAYAFENVSEYRRRVALVDLSIDDSYIIDVFWAQGGKKYDYSLHGIFGGKLSVEPDASVLLREQRKGSVYQEGIDYANDLNVNGRINGFPSAPFYFSPPGGGYGFLSNPAYYSLGSDKVNLRWDARDGTHHQMHVTHFPPSGSQLITSSLDVSISNESNIPIHPMQLEYALTRTTAAPQKRVRYATVILPTADENKIIVNQLAAKDPTEEAIGIQILPLDKKGSHLYFAAPDDNKEYQFDNETKFKGREAFVKKDKDDAVYAASITGTGHVAFGNFHMTVKPLFAKPLLVKEIVNKPLRIRVEISYTDANQLIGSVLKISRQYMARPFVVRVKDVEQVEKGTWLILDALSNKESIGVAGSYDADAGVLTTPSRFPRVRSFTFGYDPLPAGVDLKYNPYNGYFDGFWLLNKRTGEHSLIKNIQNDNREIVIDPVHQIGFDKGDEFEINILAVGDELEVPVWGEAILQENGKWKTSGPSLVSIN